jgi:hypothetical protein
MQFLPGIMSLREWKFYGSLKNCDRGFDITRSSSL